MKAKFLPILLTLCLMSLATSGWCKKTPASHKPLHHPASQPAAASVSGNAQGLADLEKEYASEQETSVLGKGPISDSLSGWNKVMFNANTGIYYFAMRPAAKGYAYVMPRPARNGVNNFFVNIAAPVRVFNCALQGQFGQAGQELERFGINTTVGVLGFGDPATNKCKIPRYNRDGDQTLAKAHMGQGMYLFWPMIGPSSVRGTLGLVIDTDPNPETYVPFSYLVDQLNKTSLAPDDYDQILRASIDPYAAVRSGYVQYREQKAKE